MTTEFDPNTIQLEPESTAPSFSPLPIQAIQPTKLIEIAIEKGADIEKLEKLMELQERWEQKEAKKAYIKAITNFRSNCPIIEKTANGYECKYAKLPDAIEIIKPVLAENDLSFSWKTENTENNIKVTCIVTHSLGYSEETSLNFPPLTATKRQNAIQAMAATVSYLERYTLFAVLGISSKDMDTDGNSPRKTITTLQQNILLNLLKEKNKKLENFLKWANITDISQMLVDDFSMARNTIKNMPKEVIKNEHK